MQYHVIDMANIPATSIETLESAYEIWFSVYNEEYKKRDLELHVEDFWNSRVVAVLTDGSKVIGCHIYNSFDIRTSVLKHKYFSDIPTSRTQTLLSEGTHTLMSMEYLLVNPEFRGPKSDIPWGQVIIGLGLKVMATSTWDAAIGVARIDKRVNSMSKKMGASEGDAVEKFGTPCKIMLLKKNELKDHAVSRVQDLISTLWTSRLDNRVWVADNEKTLRKAA